MLSYNTFHKQAINNYSVKFLGHQIGVSRKQDTCTTLFLQRDTKTTQVENICSHRNYISPHFLRICGAYMCFYMYVDAYFVFVNM